STRRMPDTQPRSTSPTSPAERPQRGIRSSGKPIKMVEYAQGWQSQVHGFEGVLAVRVLLHLNRLSFPNRPHERQPLVHVQPASASGAVSAGYNDDRVSRIYVLLGLDAKVLVDLEDAPQGAARICSNMRPRLHDTVDLLPLEVRCDLIGRRTEVALPPAVVDRSHDLHVLVRHRLLRQPHGFESFVRRVKRLGANNFPSSHGHD